MIFDSYYKNELLQHLYFRTNFGLDMRKDVNKLSELMREKLGTTLSPITLYRIFLSKKNTNTPTMTTLNLLARFCDFHDWNSFRVSVDNQRWMNQKNGSIPQKPHIKSLLNISLKNGHFDILDEYFRSFHPISELNFFEKYSLCTAILHALKDNPSQTRKFYEQFAGLPVIRASFFEIISEVGFDVQDFEYGLDCYISQMDGLDDLTKLRDQTYATCLLFKHHFIEENEETWKALGDKLLNHIQVDANLVPATFHIFPYARLLSCRYLYRSASITSKKDLKKNEDELFASIQQIHDRLNPEQEQALFFFVSECMALSNPGEETVRRLKHAFGTMIVLMPAFPKSNNIKSLVRYMDMNIANVLLRPSESQPDNE